MRKKASSDRARYEEVLKMAEAKGHGSDFVASCRRFFEDKGFLSKRQLASLEMLRAPSAYSRYSMSADDNMEFSQDEPDYDFDYGFEPW